MMIALGNGMAMEECLEDDAIENHERYQCNTLLINGPSVVQSRGWPTRYQFGAPYEAGLQFLEKEVKATHIIMKGLSLGGGMISEAILQHEFNPSIQYLCISDRTFCRLSTIANTMGPAILKRLFGIEETTGKMIVDYLLKPALAFSNTELDCIAAAKKISELGIQHIIIQHCSQIKHRNKKWKTTDGIIPDMISLSHHLKQTDFTKKIYLESETVLHNCSLPSKLSRQLKQHVNGFLMPK